MGNATNRVKGLRERTAEEPIADSNPLRQQSTQASCQAPPPPPHTEHFILPLLWSCESSLANPIEETILICHSC